MSPFSSAICCVVILFSIISASTFETESIKESKNLAFLESFADGSHPRINYHPYYWNRDRGFHSWLPTASFPVDYDSYDEQGQWPGLIDSLRPSVRILEPRFNWKTVALFGSCTNNWLQYYLDRCCEQSEACQPKPETVTLCTDVPSARLGAAFSSAQTGKFVGVGLPSGASAPLTCAGLVIARSPNTRIQINCPIINLTNPANGLRIADGASLQTIQPQPVEKSVIYTTSSSVAYILVNFSSSDDQFTCEWKAIP